MVYPLGGFGCEGLDKLVSFWMFFYSFFIFCWRNIMDFFKCSSWKLEMHTGPRCIQSWMYLKKLGCGTVSGTQLQDAFHQSNHLFILSFALGEILLQRLHFPWVHRRWVFSFPQEDLRWWFFRGVAMKGSATQEWWIWRTQISCSSLQDFAHERKLIRVRVGKFSPHANFLQTSG